MRIARLEKDQRALVLDLDPLMMMDRLDFPDAFALLAVQSDEKRREARPVGILIAEVHGELLVLDWLYVDMAHRMQGIGEQLLIAAFEYAAKNDITQLGAYRNNEYGRAEICPDDERYLREHLFYEERAFAGEWSGNLSLFMMQTGLGHKTQTSMKTTHFRGLTQTQSEEILTKLLSVDQCRTLYPISAQQRYYDPDVSVILTDGNRLRGGLLIQRIERNVPRIVGKQILRTRENILYPVLCCAQSDAEVNCMAAAALKAALMKYEATAQLHIILKTDRYAGILQLIGKDFLVNNQMLIAQVDDYVHAEEQDAQMLSMRRILQLG